MAQEAATAALLRNDDEAQAFARAVLGTLDAYADTRRRHGITDTEDFYDQVTRAEAGLVLGETERADAVYRAALANNPRLGQRKSVVAQLAHYRRCLGTRINLELDLERR